MNCRVHQESFSPLSEQKELGKCSSQQQFLHITELLQLNKIVKEANNNQGNPCHYCYVLWWFQISICNLHSRFWGCVYTSVNNEHIFALRALPSFSVLINISLTLKVNTYSLSFGSFLSLKHEQSIHCMYQKKNCQCKLTLGRTKILLS